MKIWLAKILGVDCKSKKECRCIQEYRWLVHQKNKCKFRLNAKLRIVMTRKNLNKQKKFQSGGKTSTLTTETFVLWIKMKTFWHSLYQIANDTSLMCERELISAYDRLCGALYQIANSMSLMCESEQISAYDRLCGALNAPRRILKFVPIFWIS